MGGDIRGRNTHYSVAAITSPIFCVVQCTKVRDRKELAEIGPGGRSLQLGRNPEVRLEIIISTRQCSAHIWGTESEALACLHRINVSFVSKIFF